MSIKKKERMTTKLRHLLAENDYLVAPCAYDALSARAIEVSGFQVCGTTGYGMHGVVLAQPDSGLLALNESVDILSKMADAVDIPIICDAEGGYGNALNVIRTVKEYEKTGVAGFFIEDQQQPPNCPFLAKPEVISIDEMCGKIQAAVDTRKDPDLLIIARTDAPDDEAIERANAYLDAGADMVKILPKSREALVKLPEKVHGPIHLGYFPNQPFFKNFTTEDCGKKLGYKIITFPFSVLFAQVAAELRILKYIKEHGTPEGYEGDMIDFETYIKLVHVDELVEAGNQYIKK